MAEAAEETLPALVGLSTPTLGSEEWNSLDPQSPPRSMKGEAIGEEVNIWK
jgi:hypothetical protein